MLPINFDILQADYPEYAPMWVALRRWFDANWRKRYIELSVLVRALPEVESIDLLLAIRKMIDRGMIATAYRVKAPGGSLLEGDFEEPDKIPRKLWDRDHSRRVSTAEGDLVSGYRWEVVDAA